MYNLFDKEEYQSILSRLEKLNQEAPSQWGKMNAGQMLAHCNKTFEMVTDKVVLPRMFLGYILGPFFKKQYIGEAEFNHNDPTNPYFVIKEDCNFELEKQRLIEQLKEFHQGGEAKCTRQAHSFFGKLSPAEWSHAMYKHLDHHLRQFSV